MKLKNKSPEVAATTKEAIDDLDKNHINDDKRTNQGLNHITLFPSRALDSIEKAPGGRIYD